MGRNCLTLGQETPLHDWWICPQERASYVVISMEVTHGLHYVEHASPNAEMAVLSYGFASHWSYGYWTNTEEGKQILENVI